MDGRAEDVASGQENNAMRSDLEPIDNNAMRNSMRNAMRKDDDLKTAVSTENSGTTDNNAMRNAMRKPSNCVHCGEQFEQRTTWQKYCSEPCKVKAYELRTGKKWYGKNGV
jgi:hypothetical protein